MKDNFSTGSDQYAQFRPTYPQAVFAYLSTLTENKGRAWDCGTGNGQVAVELAKTFAEVFATDFSQSQIGQAVLRENIEYSVQRAEQTNFPDDFFDLITVAQAIHWFDFEPFYQEVRRTAKPGALLVVLGYGLLKISKNVDAVIDHFYHHIVGSFWDKERRYIDENYQSIPFPFPELKVPAFSNTLVWSLDHLLGYLSTWSAVRHFIAAHGYDPLDELRPELAVAWGSQSVQDVHFPILVRIGRIQ
ncbi:class I SAM-dependent methyltransferase [Salmonirosea aquatica]|uniref:Methyltransferase domain-containing protein n=1 Tax=Salmonirosea aquatica TaxID=2654236 RepID=A0A7C9BIV5_9BACT|nr:methyltransferase domain-containing protein [Cytophagaceae bacterium SJW1-29]